MSAKNSFNALKQNPIALAIFVIGVLGFIYVCILAIQSFTSSNDGSDIKIEVSQDEINDFKNAEIQTTEQSQTKQRKAKRQRNIKERDIEGAWDSYLGNVRALLQLKAGQFRLILIGQGADSTRYYINGTYTKEEDILHFDPDPNLSPPRGKYEYEILTRADFPVMVSKHKDKMVWLRPSEEVDIYVPNYHVILNRAKNQIAVWSPLK